LREFDEEVHGVSGLVKSLDGEKSEDFHETRGNAAKVVGGTGSHGNGFLGRGLLDEMASGTSRR
jgi:hypothetical protein